MSKKLCIACHERSIHNKKRQLCLRCYGRLKYQGFLEDKCHNNPHHTAEIEFIKNYFDHSNWIYQPALFRLDEEKYSPDFYDGERSMFIEVAGTRQAYHQNKEKYKLLKQLFPKLGFEIRKPSGELLNEDSWHKEWEQYPEPSKKETP